MADVSLGSLVEQVKALSRKEKLHLREVLDGDLMDVSQVTPIDALDTELVKAGLMHEIPLSSSDSESYYDYKPVRISGKPVSQIIIEECR